MNASFPETIRTAGGQEVPVERFGDRVMWSAALVGSDQANDIELFDYAPGQLVTGDNNSAVKADERHTNVKNKGLMSSKQAMDVYSIGFEVPYNITLTALGQLSDQLYAQFKTAGERAVYDGLLRHFPAGNGLNLQSVKNGEGIVNLGAPDQQRFQFKGSPMTLSSTDQYSATLEVKGTLTGACVDTLLRCVYRGLGVSAP